MPRFVPSSQAYYQYNWWALFPRWGAHYSLPPFPKYNVLIQQIVSLLKVSGPECNINPSLMTTCRACLSSRESGFLSCRHPCLNRFISNRLTFGQGLRDRNMLINHFSNARSINMRHNWFRWELLKRGNLICTICDIDFSILLDEETYGPNPRLPIDGADVGYKYPPFESMRQHIDYDPFKYDVALLGIWFSDSFQV